MCFKKQISQKILEFFFLFTVCIKLYQDSEPFTTSKFTAFGQKRNAEDTGSTFYFEKPILVNHLQSTDACYLAVPLSL